MSLIAALFIVVAIISVASFVIWLAQQPTPPPLKEIAIRGLWLVVVILCLYILYRGVMGVEWPI